MSKAPARSSPPRRDLYYGENRDARRDRSPLRPSPRRENRDGRDGRDSRTLRETREGREPRDIRDSRDGRDTREARDSRDVRETREARDLREPRDARDYRESRDARDPRDVRDMRDARAVRDSRDTRELRDPLYDRFRDSRDPLYRRDDPVEKYRLDDLYRKRDDVFLDRYRDPLERHLREPEDRLKREERRREELYRQYFDEIQKRVDADRAVDCSVVVVNKQSKEYAESVGRKVRDLGMMVDLIFLNTEVSLTQALEDVTRGGSPFAVVITQQHQVHRSCTVNILFGTPQEHRNMPLADAMVLVARNFERFKAESRDKEREEVARQAAKMSADTILRERAEETMRAAPPPGIQSILGLLAENRFVTAEELDKVILYLRDKKERMLGIASDSLASQLSRPQLATAPVSSLESQTSSLGNNQTLQMTQPMNSVPQTTPSVVTPQQELQAKILSLFNSGSTVAANTGSESSAATPVVSSSQNYGNVNNTQQQRPSQINVGALAPSAQRPQSTGSQLATSMASGIPQVGLRNAAPRPGLPSPSQGLYGPHQTRPQVPANVPIQRPGNTTGINFDNPSVQKALDTLIQSGPALSHLVSQAAGQANRSGPMTQSSMGSYPRHF
ncbi:hypothetical protein GDO86_014142 [Hymenochirus boettgeri]|nr:hypothetical protein GDO86_014142 [Hymenochirus boettgeri]